MPSFKTARVVDSDELVADRAVCDGCDPARPCSEHLRRAGLWLVTTGAFELRDRDGAHVLDPTHALVMPAGHEFVVRHPVGPDICVAFHGTLIDRLAEAGARLAAITPAQAAGLATELTAWARGEGDELAIAELLATIADPVHDTPRHDHATTPSTRGDRALAARPPRGATRPDRDLASGIAHVLRLDFAAPTSLAELAERTGYSMFHACRAFRATTGHTIHGFRRELRLRHALARILDGDEALIEIAAHTGFASQSHLTNLFHARFGVTPAKARTPGGMRRLTA